ncbi:sensor histidine kinase [Paenibacillus sp. LHD-117]|uniref:sensor histidine kinase n=1 Tax=Paenibacillus sp. LHD-117 TaxID=3071412 RepID=UPI0027E190E5|nr:sensor histidine kinase [Paenibacillus sp. LHD-117]MDQ6421464.1 sensor histidine kinase [Paenibacillus sp. LHD-117]
MNERIRYPLPMRYRFMLVLFALIVIPFALVGYLAWSKSEKTIRGSHLDSVAQNAKNLDNFFRYVMNEQDKIMASEELQALFDPTQNDPSDEISYSNKLIAYTDALNYSNKLFRIRLFPLRPSEHPTYMRSAYGSLDLEQAPWFANIATKGRPFWKRYDSADHPNLFIQPTLGYAKRLHSLKTFSPLGVVVMEIRPSILEEFILPMRQFRNQELLLVDMNGYPAYSSNGRYNAVEPSLLNALKPSLASATIKRAGRKSLLSFSAVLGNEMRLVSIVPNKDLNNPIAVLNKVTAALLGFYFLLSLFLAGYLTMTYTNPISQLVRRMKAMARSDFKEDTLADTRYAGRSDEVGLLYRGMSAMVGEIHRLLKETKESEKRKKQLEFQVLAYQINPHFLYNTLDTIRWKAEAHHVGEISEIVSSLGSLFRLSLNGGRELTNVERELELLKAYVDIEKTRRSRPIRVTYMIEEEIRMLPLMRLVLQPLVENAIRHGISGKGEAGMIIVQGGLEEDKLIFRITDNGPGIPEEIARELLIPAAPSRKEREGGLGLINVHERLMHYFGEPYGLEIESEAGKGATVVLKHPVLSKDSTDLDGLADPAG